MNMIYPPFPVHYLETRQLSTIPTARASASGSHTAAAGGRAWPRPRAPVNVITA